MDFDESASDSDERGSDGSYYEDERYSGDEESFEDPGGDSEAEEPDLYADLASNFPSPLFPPRATSSSYLRKIINYIYIFLPF